MRINKTTLVAISALLIFAQCAKDSDDRDLDTTDGKVTSDYSVYSAILNQGFDKIKKPLVVKQTSGTGFSLSFDDDIYEMRIEPEGIGRAIYDEFILQNDTTYVLENKFEIFPREVQLITLSDLEAAFQANGVKVGWEEFYRKYPDSGGYIRFSKIGFNDKKTEALVEYAHVFGGLGADGGFVFLEREDNAWVLKKIIGVWVS